METDYYTYTPHTAVDPAMVLGEVRQLLAAVRAAVDAIETAAVEGQRALPVIQIGEEGTPPEPDPAPFRRKRHRPRDHYGK